MLGALFAVLSAATFGFNTALTRRGMISGSALQGMIITVPIGVPLVFVLAYLFGQIDGMMALPWIVVFWFALAGVVHMIWGRFSNYRATSAVGANLTGPFMQGELIVSLVLAMWILGEYLTPLRVIGIVLIFVAPMLLIDDSMKASSAGQKSSSAGAADATVGEVGGTAKPWRPRYLEGFFFASSAAIAYGLSNILVRLGLMAAEEANITNISLAAILISYIAAAVFVILWVIVAGRIRHVTQTPGPAARSFLFAGVMVSISQMLRYVALALAPVTVVAPLMRLATVFKVIFSTIINRNHEVFNHRIVLVTAISVVGAICLSVSAELVIANVPLPDWIVEIARWRWP